MKHPCLKLVVIASLAMTSAPSLFAQQSPALGVPDGFSPAPPGWAGPPTQAERRRASALPEGVTMLTGEDISTGRSIYLLMRQIARLEELNPGSGQRLLVQGVRISTASADRFIEQALAVSLEIDNENNRQREALCRSRAELGRSAAALRAFFLNSELAIEDKRERAPVSLPRTLEPGDYARLVEYARSNAETTTLTQIDWSSYLQNTAFDARAVVAAICGTTSE